MNQPKLTISALGQSHHVLFKQQAQIKEHSQWWMAAFGVSSIPSSISVQPLPKTEIDPTNSFLRVLLSLSGLCQLQTLIALPHSLFLTFNYYSSDRRKSHFQHFVFPPPMLQILLPLSCNLIGHLQERYYRILDFSAPPQPAWLASGSNMRLSCLERCTPGSNLSHLFCALSGSGGISVLVPMKGQKCEALSKEGGYLL